VGVLGLVVSGALVIAGCAVAIVAGAGIADPLAVASEVGFAAGVLVALAAGFAFASLYRWMFRGRNPAEVAEWGFLAFISVLWVAGSLVILVLAVAVLIAMF
jgi:hypothetical protein